MRKPQGLKKDVHFLYSLKFATINFHPDIDLYSYKLVLYVKLIYSQALK